MGLIERLGPKLFGRRQRRHDDDDVDDDENNGDNGDLRKTMFRFNMGHLGMKKLHD